MNFKDLHNQKEPLLIFNVWDVPSVKVAEKLNAQAVGTSSAAIASLLGYRDGEEIPFAELEYIVKRIVLNTKLPVSVDIEAGYSDDPQQIAAHIKRLSTIGVVGINIEDSLVDTDRKLRDAESFAAILTQVVKQIRSIDKDLFINVRTDTFLMDHPNPIAETKRRIGLYQEAGANGIFVPCVEKETDISELVKCTKLPINVMCMPKLPDFETLRNLGIKRISMGNFLFDTMYTRLEQTAQTVLNQQSFNSIF
ncbi:isocitrate lyase/PEP mutase family protein [Aquimarina intermedia]|uniref:2-methylisocitrate lyase-like PEP mutase family enzyme n=1 Tax=Aquimarina intermedia TaxID=350814 RepID=A0A5S5C2S2_9FLAO|nr:isocitrate lyase/phosphoenolpyruvate mutase family protein [Aquimarina intermedia]TYP73459.1 2-methylisocitrate lyase-like PEP mutase family enzyme [Aquimarina intermedia]